MRERLDEDDFIEDDDGSGYVDNGMDDFGDRATDDEDSDSDSGVSAQLTSPASRSSSVLTGCKRVAVVWPCFAQYSTAQEEAQNSRKKNDFHSASAILYYA